MKIIKKITIIFLVFLLFLPLMNQNNKKVSGKIIQVYNAGEYINPEVLKIFEKETGIKVIYNVFPSNEDMYIKVSQGSDPYDVIFPSDYMVERLIREEKLSKLDFNNIPNAKGIEKQLINPTYDKKNEYSLPYFWGTVGIVYNTKYIKENVDSWNYLWNKKYKNKIIMYDSKRDVIAIALSKLGYSMNSTNIKELNEAKETLIEQKPLLYAYLTDYGRDVLLREDAYMGIMYSGDAELIIEANPNLKYVIPKEGSNKWTDTMVIPKNAKNKKAGEKFINFLLRPDIAEKNAEYCKGYTSPVTAVKKMLPKEMAESKIAYPNIEELPPLTSFKDLSNINYIYDNIWTEVIASFKGVRIF